MIESRADYRDYLRSNEWQIKRRNKINRDADWVIKDLGILRVECCGRSIHVDDVEAHHKHYHNIGQERYEDLLIACSDCHQQLDLNQAMFSS